MTTESDKAFEQWIDPRWLQSPATIARLAWNARGQYDAAELERLQSLVATLPVDAGGNPITLGSERWAQWPDCEYYCGTAKMLDAYNNAPRVYLTRAGDDDGRWFFPVDVYPSKPEPPAPKVPTLAERREAIGWSQERLAKALIVDLTVIQRVEAGDWCHSGARRNALAAIFGCTREEIDESVEETKRRAQ